MDFTHKKVPMGLAGTLKRVSLENIQPYRVIFAPAYAFLRVNKKFVGVKGPLDFFSPEDLERLSQYECLYLSKFVTSIDLYKNTAIRIRGAIDRQNVVLAGTESFAYPELTLSPSIFEIADIVLKLLAKFWYHDPDRGIGLELFFLVPFAEELCGPLPPQAIQAAREKGAVVMECALIRSSFAVFLALHLNYFGIAFLKEIRLRVFTDNSDSAMKNDKNNSVVNSTEIDELVEFCRRTCEGHGTEYLRVTRITHDTEIISKKMFDRIERIKRQKLLSATLTPSIFGSKGFLDG